MVGTVFSMHMSMGLIRALRVTLERMQVGLASSENCPISSTLCTNQLRLYHHVKERKKVLLEHIQSHSSLVLL